MKNPLTPVMITRPACLILPDICVQGRIHGKQLTQTGQSLFRSDCKTVSSFMIPQLLRISTLDENLLLAYTKYNAKYGNTSIVKNAYSEARKAGLFRFQDCVGVGFLYVYGLIRPMFRRIYYTLFRGVKAV